MKQLLIEEREIAHICYTTMDIDQAMFSLGKSLGVEWHSPTTDNVGKHEYKIVFSKNFKPAIELIQADKSSPWSPSFGLTLHHFAFWSTNLANEENRARKNGLKIEFDGRQYGRSYFYARNLEWPFYLEFLGPDRKNTFAKEWPQINDRFWSNLIFEEAEEKYEN